MKRENELLRERLSKYESTQISSNSSVISNGSNNMIGDCDDLDSNVSSHSVSSTVTHEITNEQPKYFDRKRRLLAAEQEISPTENDTSLPKKCSPHKKACLDEIVDSLNQKAQAEKDEEVEQEEGEMEVRLVREEKNEEDDESVHNDEEEEEEIVIETNNNLTPPSTTTEREDEDEDIDIDDVKFTIVENH